MRQRLTMPRPPPEDAVVQRELAGNPDAAPEIRKYIALADTALSTKRPSWVARRRNARVARSPLKRAA